MAAFAAALALVAPSPAESAKRLRVRATPASVVAGMPVTIAVQKARGRCALRVHHGLANGRVLFRNRVPRSRRMTITTTRAGRRTVTVRCGRRRGSATFRVLAAPLSPALVKDDPLSSSGAVSDEERYHGDLNPMDIDPAFETGGSDEGGPAPDFRLPFPCGEKWRSSTYASHGNALDWNDPAKDDGGRPIVASAPGTAFIGKAGTGYGNHVVVNHGAGWSTVYAHFRAVAISADRSSASSAAPAIRQATTCTTSSA
jgi:murein DD-endopeptidase MepM/ murein hydrolase activator NlpD